MKRILLVLLLVFPMSASAFVQGSPDFAIPVSSGGGCGATGVIGTSTDNDAAPGDTADILWYSTFTPTTAGNVTYIHIKVKNAMPSSNFSVGIWDASGNLLVDGGVVNGADNDEAAWLHFELDSAYCLETGGTYLIGATSDDTFWNPRIDWDEAGSALYKIAMTHGATLANFTPGSATLVDSNVAFTITANNSADTP